MKNGTATGMNRHARAAVRFAGAALLAGTLMLSSKPLLAQADTSATGKTQKKIALMFQPKAIARVYGAAQKPAFGAGLEASADFGKASAGASGSLVLEGNKPIVEETQLWVGVPIGKTFAICYAYTDKFYNVDVKDPAFGMLLKHGIVKAGVEMGKDFTCQYLKVALPGNVTLGGVLLEWGGKTGYFAPIGGVQRAGASLGIDAKLLGKPLKVEVQYTQPTGVGKNGLQLRLVLTP